MMAWRTLSRERSSSPNELTDAVAICWRGVCLTNKGAAPGVSGPSGKGGRATSTVAAAGSGVLVSGGVGRSSGVVTRGGNGWTQLLLTLGGAWVCGVTTRRWLTVRRFIGGG